MLGSHDVEARPHLLRQREQCRRWGVDRGHAELVKNHIARKVEAREEKVAPSREPVQSAMFVLFSLLRLHEGAD